MFIHGNITMLWHNKYEHTLPFLRHSDPTTSKSSSRIFIRLAHLILILIMYRLPLLHVLISKHVVG